MMWHMYAMEYYSTIEKNEIMSFAPTSMDLEIVIQSEVREEILYNIPYMWNLKINNTDALTKEKEMHRLRE